MKALIFAVLVLATWPIDGMAATAVVQGCKPGVGWFFGYGTNYPSVEGAEQRAMAECAAYHLKCRSVGGRSGGGYIAIAEDLAHPCGAWGLSRNVTLQAARSQALETCQKHGGTDCRVDVQYVDAGEGGGSYGEGSPGDARDYSAQQQQHRMIQQCGKFYCK